MENNSWGAQSLRGLLYKFKHWAAAFPLGHVKTAAESTQEVTKSPNFLLQQNHDFITGAHIHNGMYILSSWWLSLSDNFSPPGLAKNTGFIFLCHQEKEDKIIKPARSYMSHDLRFIIV